MRRFSVIVPALDESQIIRACIAGIQAIDPEMEIILADGGSQDATGSIAAQMGVAACSSPPGRGVQCNAGAALASGEILLFLHADSRLPRNAFHLLEEIFQDERVQIGTFRLAFDQPNWLLELYAWFSRFDSIFTRFGDQCIVVRRSFFETLGGFPDWPLFEDVRILQLARQKTRIHSFPALVTTSARRYMQYGILRQQLRNLGYMLQYLAGVPSQRLAEQYQRAQPRTENGFQKSPP